MNLWGHRFPQNANQNFSRFLSWEGRRVVYQIWCYKLNILRQKNNKNKQSREINNWLITKDLGKLFSHQYYVLGDFPIMPNFEYRNCQFKLQCKGKTKGYNKNSKDYCIIDLVDFDTWQKRTNWHFSTNDNLQHT